MRRWCVIAPVLVVLLLGVPGFAQAASPGTSLAWFQGVGRGFTSDRELLLLPSNATFSASGTASKVTVTGAAASGGFSVTVAAPQGRSLQPGRHYIRAQPAATADPWRPGIHVRAPDFDCWDASGSFEVKDVVVSVQGVVQRAWIVYDVNCGMSGPPVKGEVRYGMPAPPEGSLSVAPAVTRWPADDRLRRSAARHIWVIGANARSRIARSAVIGSREFAVGTCWPRAEDPPNTCRLPSEYRRESAGTHRSTLRITDTGGIAHDVAIEGFTYGGVTQFVASSEHEDEWVGGGRDYHHDAEELAFWAAWSRSELDLAANEYDSTWITAEFEAKRGDVLEAGREYVDDAIGYEPGNVLDVTVNGHACGDEGVGRFRFDELRFDLYEKVRSLSVSFQQSCGRGNWRFAGRWDFRAGDATPLAPWMVADPAAQDPGPPPPPETTITEGPQGTTTETTPTFRFGASRGRVVFECRLDGVGYFGCESPFVPATLADGTHTFEVRARDHEGFVDPTPAKRTFTVDTDPSTPPAHDGGAGSVTSGARATAAPGTAGGPASVAPTRAASAEREPVRLGLSIPRRTTTVRLPPSGVLRVPGLRAACPASRPACRLRVEIRAHGRLLGVARMLIRGGARSTVLLRLPRRVTKLVRRSTSGLTLHLRASLSGARTVRRHLKIQVMRDGG